jgi:hypothetical protein
VKLAVPVLCQAPRDLQGVLDILGDKADPVYPIYRTGDQQLDTTVLTLCTAVWDTAAKALVVLIDNPKKTKRLLTLRLDSSWKLQLLQV